MQTAQHKLNCSSSIYNCKRRFGMLGWCLRLIRRRTTPQLEYGSFEVAPLEQKSMTGRCLTSHHGDFQIWMKKEAHDLQPRSRKQSGSKFIFTWEKRDPSCMGYRFDDILSSISACQQIFKKNAKNCFLQKLFSHVKMNLLILLSILCFRLFAYFKAFTSVFEFSRKRGLNLRLHPLTLPR